MGAVHGLGEQTNEPSGLARWLRYAVALTGQAAAVDELQREVRPTVAVADLVDLHNVGVLQAGDGLALGAKASPFRGAGVGAGQDHFEGHQAIEARCRALYTTPMVPCPSIPSTS